MNCMNPGIQKPQIPIVRFTSGLVLGKPNSACPPQMKYPVPKPKNPMATGTKGEFANVNTCGPLVSLQKGKSKYRSNSAED